MDVCRDPDILKVIYFFLLIIDIVKIIIPIALIVLGLVDFSKAMISNDEKAQKKSGQLFIKRLIYAVLVFAVPWIVEVLMVTLGNLAVTDPNEVNFTDCIENANPEMIEALENGTYVEKKCYVCNTNNELLKWTDRKPSYDSYNYACPSGWKETDIKEEDCGVKQCYQCNSNSSLYAWAVSESHITSNCPSNWHTRSDLSEEECK